MNEDDDALWERVTKGIKRLNPTHKFKKPEPAKSPRKTQTAPIASYVPKTAADTLRQRSTDVDRRTDDRLRRGKLPIEGRIDLHGMGRIEAQTAIQKFITKAHAQNKRCLLVITGKGLLDKPGILKTSLPDWLSAPDLAPLVLKIYPAQPQHGGSGAFYIYLRRKRG